jgi:hypothetical protein
LPEKIISKTKEDLIEYLYGDINSVEDLKEIVCLSTRNDMVNDLNIEIQNRILPDISIKKGKYLK